MKYMGKKSNYIRVMDISSKSHKYIEFSDINTYGPIDTKYYFEKLKKSLIQVTTALGIDFDPIFSGHIISN